MEKTKSYNREYYMRNKTKRRERIECELCGRKMCREYLIKHQTKGICFRQRGNPVDPTETNETQRGNPVDPTETQSGGRGGNSPKIKLKLN